MASRHHFSAASYPATYRGREVETIVAAIRARKSILISGLAGMGKSHLVRFLASNENFRQRYFPKDSTDFAFFFVDCNAMNSQGEGSFYRTIITELRQQTGLETGHRLQGMTNAELLIALKACLDSLYQERITLVFILDRFDKFHRNEKLGRILDNLRHLRDYFARRISYVLAGRGEIDVASISEEFEDLLYYPAIIYLKPLAPADAEGSIERYEREYNVALDRQSKQKLIRYSGGYPRLLRAGCELVREGKVNLATGEAEVVRQLINEPHIQAICQKIWEGLSDKDQVALRLVPADSSAPKDHSLLLQHALVTIDQNGLAEIFCPLFEAFVRESAELGLSLQLAPPNKVQMGDKLVSLTPLEFSFLACLLETPEQIRAYDEIIEQVYPDVKVKRGVTPQALAAIVKRLREKIHVPGHDFIRNVRGVGYCLYAAPDTAKMQR